VRHLHSLRNLLVTFFISTSPLHRPAPAASKPVSLSFNIILKPGQRSGKNRYDPVLGLI
jgi:hypothetical protein